VVRGAGAMRVTRNGRRVAARSRGDDAVEFDAESGAAYEVQPVR